MKIYKEIKIDLNKWINKIRDPEMDYTDAERAALNILYAAFEEGRFEEAMKYAQSWNNDEKELIPCEIWDVLFDINIGANYYVREDLVNVV